MGRFEHLVEKQRLERRRPRVLPRGSGVPMEAIVSEWRPAPLGSLGRRLWEDIDRYLEFFAIARGDEGEAAVNVHGRARRARARGLFHV